MSSVAMSMVADPIWEERVDHLIESIREAVRLARAAVVRERAVLRFYFAVRGLNAPIIEFLDSLDEATRDLQDGKLSTPEPADSIDPPDIIAKLEMVYGVLSGLYTLATAAGLKSKALTKGELLKLHTSTERLKDYIVWLLDVATPEARVLGESMFEDGMREFESGESVAFS